MGKARLVVLFGAVVALIFAAVRFLRGADEVDVGSARPAASAAKTPLARASERVLSELPGVYLTMSQPALMRARPAVYRNAQGDEPSRLLLEEGLPDGRKVLYFVEESDLRLQRVQIAARLRGVEDIQGRVDAEDARFGTSSGIWDCPLMKGSLPTRRFTWVSDGVGVMDNYLIVGEAVSATLVVASPAVISESLTAAKCQPVPAERIPKFPVVPKPSELAPPASADSKDSP